MYYFCKSFLIISSVVQRIDKDGNVHGFFYSDEILTLVYWSERGVSKVYLRDIQIVDLKRYRPLRINALKSAMPKFNWDPGPSGSRITAHTSV